MTTDFDEQSRRIVHFLLTEAVSLDAAEIRLVLENERTISVSYLVRDLWQERPALPSALWPAVHSRLCSLARVSRQAPTLQFGSIPVKQDQREFRIDCQFVPDELGATIHLAIVR